MASVPSRSELREVLEHSRQGLAGFDQTQHGRSAEKSASEATKPSAAVVDCTRRCQPAAASVSRHQAEDLVTTSGREQVLQPGETRHQGLREVSGTGRLQHGLASSACASSSRPSRTSASARARRVWGTLTGADSSSDRRSRAAARSHFPQGQRQPAGVVACGPLHADVLEAGRGGLGLLAGCLARLLGPAQPHEQVRAAGQQVDLERVEAGVLEGSQAQVDELERPVELPSAGRRTRGDGQRAIPEVGPAVPPTRLGRLQLRGVATRGRARGAPGRRHGRGPPTGAARRLQAPAPRSR